MENGAKRVFWLVGLCGFCLLGRKKRFHQGNSPSSPLIIVLKVGIGGGISATFVSSLAMWVRELRSRHFYMSAFRRTSGPGEGTPNAERRFASSNNRISNVEMEVFEEC